MTMPWTMVAAAAAFACTATAAQADTIDLPARKPGLWQMTITPKPEGKGPQMTARLCLDAASDKTLMQYGLAVTISSCTTEWSRDEAGAYVFDVACDIIGHKSSSHGVLSGDFQSHYILDVVSEFGGDKSTAPKLTGITQDSTWIGACEADMRPGDMLLPGGRRTNLLDVIRRGG